MAPGLMPGDVVATSWMPLADRLRRPRRFEAWIAISPHAGVALKRIAGLPNEMVEIRDGDLLVDGAIVRKTPTELGAVAIPVTLPLRVGERRARLPAAEVLDDDTFASDVNRVLEPVRDVGLMTLLRTGMQPSHATVVLGGTTLHWRLPPQASIRLIAGRLDGHLVAVAWRDRLTGTIAALGPRFPIAVPSEWSFAEPCPEAPGHAMPPRCDVRVSEAAVIDEARAWRDVHLRPASNGTASWQLDGGSYLLLGDFPSGSIDSRSWGPLPAAALRHRVQPSH